MSNYNTKLLIHAVFSTNKLEKLLTESIERHVFKYIDDQCKYLKSPLIAINGTIDHIHLLVLLSHDKSVAELLHQIKGASSHSINQNNFLKVKFAWQRGYSAFSVSESQVEKTVEFIRNQKIKHYDMSFSREIAILLKKHRVSEGNGLIRF